MKDSSCKCEVRSYLTNCMLHTRDELNLSQMEFAAELHIDRRSYLDIEHGKNLCCSMTLLYYLCYHCKDPLGVLAECRSIFDRHNNMNA